MNPILLNRWTQLTLSNDWNDQESQQIVDQLDDLYNGHDRFYHNWIHIQDCLNKLDKQQLSVERHQAVELAIWFHDAIYDTHRTDNELASAKLAERALNSLESTETLVKLVSKLVCATDHRTYPTSKTEELLIDIDLSILGTPIERYQTYCQQIRKEYNWVPENDYRQGRISILENFLNRPKIFYTKRFQQNETLARTNLEWEVVHLTKSD